MSTKSKYWMTEARSGLIVLIGAAPAVFSFRDGNDTAGYVFTVLTIVLAALAFLFVDRRKVRELDGASA
jgi:uncharacterized membrane protein